MVAVPARNEQDHIEACVRSIRTAVANVRDVMVVAVVASDGSTDDTEGVINRLHRPWAPVHLIRGRWQSAGGARRAAIVHGLTVATHAGHVDTHAVWIATTDADTIVAPDWLAAHIAYAEAGFDAVAGTVDLIRDDDLTNPLLTAFTESYTIDADSHPHVHGANMGVRADAYLAADGFPHIDVAEDHALWNELRRQNYRTISPLNVRVSTSARRSGRAVGGFADTMAGILGRRGA
ncbi:MAG: glycosyltransferase family 2 protein [Ilumatobacteraceae bacterium]